MSIARHRPRLAVTAAILVAALALALWPPGSADAVDPEAPRIAFLARSDVPVDALAAGPIAAQLGGVLLVTPSTELHPAAAQALQDFAPDLVILAGGAAALSAAVEQQVNALGFATERASGPDRHSTAAALAGLLNTNPAAYLHRSDGPGLTRVAGFASNTVVTQPFGGALVAVFTVASVEITAPSAGWLVVQGGANLHRPNGPVDVVCGLRIGTSDLTGTARQTRLDAGNRGLCETSTVTPVSAGNHTVQLRAVAPVVPDAGPDADRVRAENRSLTVHFVPYDGSGQPGS